MDQMLIVNNLIHNIKHSINQKIFNLIKQILNNQYQRLNPNHYFLAAFDLIIFFIIFFFFVLTFAFAIIALF